MYNIKQTSTGDWLKSYENGKTETTSDGSERGRWESQEAELIKIVLGQDWEMVFDNEY